MVAGRRKEESRVGGKGSRIGESASGRIGVSDLGVNEGMPEEVIGFSVAKGYH